MIPLMVMILWMFSVLETPYLDCLLPTWAGGGPFHNFPTESGKKISSTTNKHQLKPNCTFRNNVATFVASRHFRISTQVINSWGTLRFQIMSTSNIDNLFLILSFLSPIISSKAFINCLYVLLLLLLLLSIAFNMWKLNCVTLRTAL